MHPDLTVEEIINECQRFRILSVGRAGAGKSSLINCVFNVNDAKVSRFEPGEADIYSEITSETNTRFVLHDSKGFEPSKKDTFDVVREFILKKTDSKLEPELKDRLHAAWLCIRTPTHGARLLEAGDEQFLKLAHERQIPVVVVFTNYDRLVRMYTENREKAAQSVFDVHVKSLQDAADRLRIEMPKYINVSVKGGYSDNIVPLVSMTQKIVKDRLEGDAWIMWSIAQMVSLPLKIEACVDKGINYYPRALTGSIPGVGKLLLRECLLKVHQDIIACWNLRNTETVVNGDNFKHLMLYVIQDMQSNSHTRSSPVDIEKISNFVTLCAAVTSAIAPPVAILGLTFFFVSWISNAVLDNTPAVQRVLIAYTVDLIMVLQELFKITLQPKSHGSVSWPDLQEAFEAYQRTTSQRTVHSAVSDLVEKRGQLSMDLTVIRESVKEMLEQYRVI
ncbi:hypothetical protein DFH08DRAFT_767296 [Mycena albidolilacea]|uniref:G domain-containing protein n=1 Tax=Mycena albidolilacea TaxID=1033008 RepID=A0AAD7F311_9AGAR|nr:hypothetical protein DFH08DRAFT_767296 [Mycena albidolilacea]